VNTGFLTIYWREMKRFLRFRAQLFSSLLQPALWLAFFGVAMSSSLQELGGGGPGDATGVGYLTFMAAGVIALTTLFTSLYGGISLLFDKNWGLMREIMASPMPRTHLVVGMGLSGMTKSFIQAGVIMAFGILIGVDFFSGSTGLLQTAASVAGVFAFVGVFSLAFLFLSSTISLRMETPEGVQGIITLLTMPLFFSSNALYPVDAFPPFLRVLAVANPLTHLVNGIRYFAIGPDFTAMGVHYVYTPESVLLSFGVLVAFAVLMFIIAWQTVKHAVVT